MKYVIAPSILSADFTQLGKDIKETEEGGAAYLHFDVMDGMFVPNISFGIPVMKSIRKATHQVMDAHLMVQDPIRYVKAFKEAGADLITVHLEACPDVRKTLTEIKDLGIMAGLSICPETPVEEIREEEIRAWEEMPIEEHMEHYLSQGMDKKEAMKAVAKDRGISKRDVYQQLL